MERCRVSARGLRRKTQGQLGNSTFILKGKPLRGFPFLLVSVFDGLRTARDFNWTEADSRRRSDCWVSDCSVCLVCLGLRFLDFHSLGMGWSCLGFRFQN